MTQSTMEGVYFPVVCLKHNLNGDSVRAIRESIFKALTMFWRRQFFLMSNLQTAFGCRTVPVNFVVRCFSPLFFPILNSVQKKMF